MCRSCGAIVGAGENQCAVCGAPTSAAPAAPPPERGPDSETIRFAKAVLNRPYKFTIFLLVANLFVFMLMWESSGLTSEVLWQGFPEPVLIAYGAKLNSLVNAPYYQWWRFIAPMFIHVNLIHLLVNMYSLLMVGPFVEKLYGGARFIVFWVFTGIAGVAASYLTVRPNLAHGSLGRFIFKNVDWPSAGASGALFGLVGVLFVFGIKFRNELPEGFKRAFGTGLLPIILINLFIGFLGRQFIDNAAHLGGLLAGAAIALAVNYRRPGARSMITPVWRTLQILSLSIIALGAYKVVRNFSRPVLARATPNANTLIFVNYVRAMSEVQEKVSAVIHNNDLSDANVIAQRATEAPAPDARATELRNRLVGILSKLVEASTAASPAASPSTSPAPARQLDQELVDEFRAWQKDYNEWLKGASRSYTRTS